MSPNTLSHLILMAFQWQSYCYSIYIQRDDIDIDIHTHVYIYVYVDNLAQVSYIPVQNLSTQSQVCKPKPLLFHVISKFLKFLVLLGFEFLNNSPRTFCFSWFFLHSIFCFCLAGLGRDLSTYSFHVAEMIGVHHHPGLLVEGWDFFFFFCSGWLWTTILPNVTSWVADLIDFKLELNNASTLWEMIHGCPWEHCFDELGDYST